MAFRHKPRVAGTWVDCSNCWSYDTWNYIVLHNLFVETTPCIILSNLDLLRNLLSTNMLLWNLHRDICALALAQPSQYRIPTFVTGFALEVFTASPANLWYRYALPSRPQTVDSAFPKAGYNSSTWSMMLRWSPIRVIKRKTSSWLSTPNPKERTTFLGCHPKTARNLGALISFKFSRPFIHDIPQFL